MQIFKNYILKILCNIITMTIKIEKTSISSTIFTYGAITKVIPNS